MKLLLTIFTLILAVNTSAQKLFTLNDCLDTAVSNHPDILLKKLDIIKSSNLLDQATADQIPKISPFVTIGLNGGRSIDPYTNTYVQSTFGQNLFGLGVDYNLLQLLTNRNRIKQKKINIDSEKFSLDDIKREIKLKVIESYLMVVINHRLLSLFKESESELRSQMAIISEKIKEGQSSKYSLLETEAQLGRTIVEQKNANMNYQIAKSRLARTIFAADKDFEVEIPKAGEVFDTLNLNQENSIHPKLAALDEKLKAADISTTIVKMENFPSIVMSTGLGTSYSSFAGNNTLSYFSQLNNNFNQYFNLTLSVPIFNKRKVKYKVNEAIIEKDILIQERNKVEYELRKMLDEIKQEIQLLNSKLSSSKENLSIQEDLYNGVKEKFKEGLANNLELSTYRLNFEHAKIQHIQIESERLFKQLYYSVFRCGEF